MCRNLREDTYLHTVEHSHWLNMSSPTFTYEEKLGTHAWKIKSKGQSDATNCFKWGSILKKHPALNFFLHIFSDTCLACRGQSVFFLFTSANKFCFYFSLFHSEHQQAGSTRVKAFFKLYKAFLTHLLLETSSIVCSASEVSPTYEIRHVILFYLVQLHGSFFRFHIFVHFSAILLHYLKKRHLFYFIRWKVQK